MKVELDDVYAAVTAMFRRGKFRQTGPNTMESTVSFSVTQYVPTDMSTDDLVNLKNACLDELADYLVTKALTDEYKRQAAERGQPEEHIHDDG